MFQECLLWIQLLVEQIELVELRDLISGLLDKVEGTDSDEGVAKNSLSEMFELGKGEVTVPPPLSVL